MKNMKKLLLFVLSAALAAPLFAQRRVQRDTVRIGGKPVGVTVTNWYCIEGDELPAFTVRDQNGKTIRSADLRGKTVVVSFWIGSCAPCLKELGRVGPEIVDRYSPDEFAFIAIGSGETAESAARFGELAGATFPLCYDASGEVFGRFADNGFPKLFVADAGGTVRMVEQGYDDAKFARLEQTVAGLIRENRRELSED